MSGSGRAATTVVLAVLVALVGGTPPAFAEGGDVPGVQGGQACQPAVLALPLPPGMVRGDVIAVRGSLAVGFAADASHAQHAAAWTRSGESWVVHDLGDFGLPSGEPFSATGVDARGDVAVGVNAGVMAGWLVTDGVEHRLSDFAGGTNAYVRAINGSGEMVGEALDAQGNDFGAVWAHWWSAPARLAPAEGYDGSYAQGVDDAGVVVGGSFSFGDLPTLATRWSRTGMPAAVGALGADAEATNVNDDGTVVGRGFGAFPTALRWDRWGHVADSGLFADAQFARAFGVDARGDVTGFEGANLASGIVRHVLYWPASGRPSSLLPLSLDWSDGALSHVIGADGTVYGSSSVDHASFPRPTVWTCPGAQAFTPTASGPPTGYRPPVVRGLQAG